MNINCVFFNNKTVYLIDDFTAHQRSKRYDIDEMDFNDLLDLTRSKDKGPIYIFGKDKAMLIKKFKSWFKIIKAAGGLVRNKNKDSLFIFRNEKWDLPKGKIEKGEKKKKAAIREVEEETGIDNLKLIRRLENTYHIYKIKDKYILKVTYWYEMNANFEGKLMPQLEEGITKVAWLDDEQQIEALENTYGNIRLLFD